jgi:REP element-mobilizing transposase RayT
MPITNEVLVNYFESASSETEQMQSEQKENQFNTASRVNIAASDHKREEERLSTSLKLDGGVHLDALLQNPHDLSYACLLIPRFSDHYLTGDITLNLPVWMKEICVSYGWRLESIVIRPGYIQWALSVPPVANPAQIIRITRQHTSQKILSEFPRYKQQNLSGDFWAPGYSIIAGNQLQTPETISNFIQLTRKQQGIY